MIISGTVKDVNGIPLMGVHVYPLRNGESYGVGTVTDYDGKFLLDSNEITSGQIVRLTYIGFKPQEIPARNVQNQVYIMEESAESLDEIVLIGKKAQPKKNNKILEYVLLALGVGSLCFVGFNIVKQNR